MNPKSVKRFSDKIMRQKTLMQRNCCMPR